MSNLDKNAEQYGRRTWNKGEYDAKAEALARKDAQKEREEDLRLKGIKTEKRKYYDAPDAAPLEARKGKLGVEAAVGKRAFVSAKTGRAGFHCETCDRTFQDHLSWIDHLNSNRHLRATGHATVTQRATLAEVQERIAFLAAKANAPRQEYNLHERVRAIQAMAERKKAMRREARAKRRAKLQSASKGEGEEEPMEMDPAMAAMMGFGGFGTTKRG